MGDLCINIVHFVRPTLHQQLCSRPIRMYAGRDQRADTLPINHCHPSDAAGHVTATHDVVRHVLLYAFTVATVYNGRLSVT